MWSLFMKSNKNLTYFVYAITGQYWWLKDLQLNQKSAVWTKNIQVTSWPALPFLYTVGQTENEYKKPWGQIGRLAHLIPRKLGTPPKCFEKSRSFFVLSNVSCMRLNFNSKVVFKMNLADFPFYDSWKGHSYHICKTWVHNSTKINLYVHFYFSYTRSDYS